jgi:hypothetical protein
MAIIDKNTMLSGGDGVAQTLAGATSDYSDDYIDLKTAIPGYSNGAPVTLSCIPTTGLGSGTVGADAKLELRGFPVLQGSVAIASCAITTSSDILTKAAHGLTNGTHVKLSSLATSTLSDATALDCYVINATTDTFQISTTPDGATAVGFGGSDGTVTVTIQPVILASSGLLPIIRFAAEEVVSITTNPMPGGFPQNVRYVYAYVEAEAAFNAGAALFQLSLDSVTGSAPFAFHASGFTV